MPKKEGVFLRLISVGYEGKLRNRRVYVKNYLFSWVKKRYLMVKLYILPKC